MPRARVNDIHLFYDEAGGGRSVIFVHAYPMGRKMWAPQAARFQERYRVITYDCRGFGDSDAPVTADHYSQVRSVEDLRGLCLAVHVERAAVVGLSMGGNIALHFALTYPALAAGVVICDTGAGSDDPAQFQAVTDGWAQAAEAGGAKGFAAAILQHPIFSGYAARGPAEAAAMRRMIAAHPAHGVAHTARETLAKRPPIFALETKLQTLSVPALIVVGERDLPCIAPSEYMARKIPNADLHVMMGCGHFNNLEQPAEFNRVVEAFFHKIGWEG
jgi:pimeloyl-ACP methyl ester carboxylesterase